MFCSNVHIVGLFGCFGGKEGGGAGKSKIFSLPPLSLFFTVAHPMILISFSPHPSTAIRIKDSVDSCC